MINTMSCDTQGNGFLHTKIEQLQKQYGTEFPTPEPYQDVYIHPIVDALREFFAEGSDNDLMAADDSLNNASELSRCYVAASGTALDVLYYDPSPQVRMMVALQGEHLEELQEDSHSDVAHIATMMKSWLEESEWRMYIHEIISNPDWTVIVNEETNKRVSTIKDITGFNAEHALSTNGEECLNDLVHYGVLVE